MNAEHERVAREIGLYRAAWIEREVRGQDPRIEHKLYRAARTFTETLTNDDEFNAINAAARQYAGDILSGKGYRWNERLCQWEHPGYIPEEHAPGCEGALTAEAFAEWEARVRLRRLGAPLKTHRDMLCPE